MVLLENKGLWSHCLLVEWEVSLIEQVFQFYGGEKEEEGGDAPKEMGKKEVSQSLVECKYPILLMCALLHVGLFV